MKFSRNISHCRRDEFHESPSQNVHQSGTRGTRPSGCRPASAFTLIEIAICLAIIGFALVAIIGVLPIGMNTQRDNREETVINQDASVFIEAIRSGSRGADYLTNYVYAITNYQAWYNNGVGSPPAPWGVTTADSLTNGENIIGLLSTPEFVPSSDDFPGSENGTAAVMPPEYYFRAASNHIVAYVRSISGLAAEKPPQDNQIMREDTFSYKLLVVNAPMSVDTNLLQNYPHWEKSTIYPSGSQVFYNGFCWQAWTNTFLYDPPGASATDESSPTPYGPPPRRSNPWAKVPNYVLEQAASQRELRLTFMWPLLPNGNVGGGRQTFRVTIPGQLVHTSWVYYNYQPQSFPAAP